MMVRFWVTLGACAALLGTILAGLHMLQADRDRAYARGHEAGQAQVMASLAREAAQRGQQSQAALDTAEEAVVKLERDRDALQDQLAKLNLSAQDTALGHRLCLDAERVRALNALGSANPSAGP